MMIRPASIVVLVATCCTCLMAADTLPLVDVASPDVVKLITPSTAQVSFARPSSTGALVVTCTPGPDAYPGITLTPARPWDLSRFGHLSARLTNTGANPITICMRVDNAGSWENSNAENLQLDPGKSGTLEVVFGYAWGKQPSYNLNAAAVVRVLLFAGKSEKAPQSFRIDSIEAGGKPGEAPAAKPASPDDERVAVTDGILLGAHVPIDAANVDAQGAQAIADGSLLKITFPASEKEQSVSYHPKAGRWDLRPYLQVAVKLKNTGTIPIAPRLRLDSNTGPTDWVAPAAPIAPGAAADVVIPFASRVIWDGSKDAGNHFVSDAVSRLSVSIEKSEGAGALTIESAQASVPPPHLPEWLGKRPPVDGEWTRTFDDEFSGSAIDATKWDVTGENYYDKLSHWSKENVIVSNGEAHLRYERKRGHQNDDPSRNPETDYASGFLTTFGKWSQRYGYFESRMKLPTAPGLWPAFWMMPDRGPNPSNGDRQSTSDGGMEFDIMEYLSRWGPYRYNIAMHWDGYGDKHKAVGSEHIYFQPDAQGYITAGMLWTPGSLTYYANGTPVLKWENPRVSSVPATFLFTLPMGGWDNDALDDKKLPNDFAIDYVRVWQRKDLASPTDGFAPHAEGPKK